MIEQPSEDEMDSLERALTPRHVPESGFTARVMAALPPAKRRVPRRAILAIATAVGATIAIASPAAEHVTRLVRALASVEHRSSAALVLVCLVAVLMGSALQTASE